MRKCPRDSETLDTIRYEGVEIETCRQCGGEFLDGGELKAVIDARQQRWEPTELEKLKSASIRGEAMEDHEADMPCPACGTLMKPFNYGGDTGIVLDKCGECGGIWLDADEIENVQKVVESWETTLDDDLKKYCPKMRQVAARVDAEDDATVSRLGFVNAAMNGILDIF